jgi:hypothetical protein
MSLSTNKYAWKKGKQIPTRLHIAMALVNRHTSMLTDRFLMAVANTLLKAQLVLASRTQLELQITTILVTAAPKQMHILFSSLV